MPTRRRSRVHLKTAVTLLLVVVLATPPLLLCVGFALLLLFYPTAFTFFAGVWVVDAVAGVLYGTPVDTLGWLESNGLAVPLAAVVALGWAWQAHRHVYVPPSERPPGIKEFVTAPATHDEQPALLETVRSVAQRFDCPEPEVLVAGPDAPPAMTVGLRAKHTKLVVSTRTMEILTPEELEAVVAHELAHVNNRDSVFKTFLVLPNRLIEGSLYVAFYIVHLVFPLLLPYYLAVKFVAGGFSRTREIAADRAAARLTGNPAALASALETLAPSGEEPPDTDARTETAGSLSIVPLAEEYAVRTDWDRQPLVWSVQKPIRKAWAVLTANHPRPEERLDALRDLERDQERQ